MENNAILKLSALEIGKKIKTKEITSVQATQAFLDAIDALDTKQSLFFDHHDGEVTKMFLGLRGLV